MLNTPEIEILEVCVYTCHLLALTLNKQFGYQLHHNDNSLVFEGYVPSSRDDFPRDDFWGVQFWNRAAQCIDKEILISKNGNIYIDIEIDNRIVLIIDIALILIRAYFDN